MADTQLAGSRSPSLWPSRVRQLTLQLRQSSASDRSLLRTELWLALQSAISGYACLHSRRLGALSEPDLHDLSAQKSLDLMTEIDSLKWTPDDDGDGQVRAFISTVSRNGVVDMLRANSRTTTLSEQDDMELPESKPRADQTTQATDQVESNDFIRHLRACVETLTPRARRLWFFRALYEMPSKAIARHPEVQMSVGHVDVALQRCRSKVSECMQSKDLRLDTLPQGTFSALWEACTRDRGSLLQGDGDV